MNFRVKDKTFNMDNEILVMGILNVTDDSFSDGGKFLSLDKASEQALKLMATSDIVDIGGESTRPGAKEISIDEECSRVVPVIESLSSEDIIISVDTMKSEVAREALNAGASIINDVSSLSDPKMATVVNEFNASLILMHIRGTPRTMQSDTHYDDIVGEIKDYLKERVEFAESLGIKRGKICIDPGIGFGKSVEGNFEILNRLYEFSQLDLPVLIGLSKKSFIGKSFQIDNPRDRSEATEMCHFITLNGGANIIRTHDSDKTSQTVEIYKKYKNLATKKA